jgi:hypothetical protein
LIHLTVADKVVGMSERSERTNNTVEISVMPEPSASEVEA